MRSSPRPPARSPRRVGPSRSCALGWSALALLTLPLLAGFAPVGGAESPEPQRLEVLVEGGDPEASVDVLFVGDGYTREHLREGGLFWRDAERFAEQLLQELPFRWYRDRFNVSALGLESEEAGCDQHPWRDHASTALETFFDHPRGRILRFRDEARLTDLVRAVGDVDIVFVMVNTGRYGGSGSVLRFYRPSGEPCPAPVFSARHSAGFSIAVHELGHSFAGLTDEYEDTTLHGEYPLPAGPEDVAYPNATLRGRFDASSFDALRRTVKWGHLLELPEAGRHAWLHEGSYYRAEGVFRPWPTCKMRSYPDPFCPVCAEALARAVARTCGEAFDAAAFHDAHPLATWAPAIAEAAAGAPGPGAEPPGGPSPFVADPEQGL